MRTIHYFSTVRGITEQETGNETVYYGKMLRISREQFAKDEHVTLEKELLRELDTGTWGPGDAYPVPGGTIERYEVFEAETGDMLIMYRVPYQVPKVRNKQVH